MSADPTNGQSNIDVILKAMAPDRREAFLRSRNRLKQFNENDEILALAHYLDTVVVMVDGLTKNVAAAMTAHTEPMANLTAQLKRVAAELPSHANTLTPKTIRRWLASGLRQSCSLRRPLFSGAGYRPNANNLIAWQPL